MLSQVFFLLFASGLFLSFGSYKDKKFIKSMPILVYVTVCYMFFSHYGEVSEYKLAWISLPSLKLILNLSSSPILYPILLMPFILVGVVIFNNYFFPTEKDVSKNCGIALLTLSAFILFITAVNFLQLFFAIQIISLTSFATSFTSNKRNYYMGMIILSDIALLAGFAILYGQFDTMKIANMSYYSQHLLHKNLVSGLFLFAFLTKSILFLFHSEVLVLQDIGINRLFSLLFTGTPMISVFVFIKMYPIISKFIWFSEIFAILLWATVILGGISLILSDSIKTKGIYLFMIFSAVILFLVKKNIDNPYTVVTSFYLTLFLLWQIFYCVTISASNEVNISHMGDFINKLPVVFLLSVFIIFVFLCQILNAFKTDYNIFYITSFVVIFICFAHFQKSVFFPPSRASEKVEALLKNPPFWYLASIITGSLYIFQELFPVKQNIVIFFIAYCLFLIATPFNKIIITSNIRCETNIIARIYETIFVLPLKVLGRVLWITIGFVFFERTIFSSIHKIYRFMILISQTLSKADIKLYIILITLGIISGFMILRGLL